MRIQEVTGSILTESDNILFVEIDQEIFSTVILPLPLIQEGSCQFLAKECAQVLVNLFRGLNLPRKSVIMYTD